MAIFLAIVSFRCFMFFSIHILSIRFTFERLIVETICFNGNQVSTRAKLFLFIRNKMDVIFQVNDWPTPTYRIIASNQARTTRKVRSAKLTKHKVAAGRKSLIYFISL